MFGAVTLRKMKIGSDFAAVIKVERRFELLGAQKEGVRSLYMPEQWLKLLLKGKKCHVKEKKCI